MRILNWSVHCNVSILFSFVSADINVVSRTEGDIITVGGKEYLKFSKFEAKPQFGDLKVFSTGLFPDPELSTYSMVLFFGWSLLFLNFSLNHFFIDRIVMEFVNQYWPFFVNEMMPQVCETIEPMIIEEANKFLLHVPIRSMLYYGEESN